MVSHGMSQATEEQNSALRKMKGLLEEWRILTEAENAAITSETWAELELLHGKKGACQLLIEQAELSIAQDPTLSPSEKEDARSRFRLQIGPLIQLEERNRDLLARKMAHADAQLKVSDRTIRSLRHIQQAYGVGSRSFWHAYS